MRKGVALRDITVLRRDERLDMKYGINKSEQKFIESMIKPME